jgi:hypothetical protein
VVPGNSDLIDKVGVALSPSILILACIRSLARDHLGFVPSRAALQIEILALMIKKGSERIPDSKVYHRLPVWHETLLLEFNDDCRSIPDSKKTDTSGLQQVNSPPKKS